MAMAVEGRYLVVSEFVTLLSTFTKAASEN
jgi:hypothetical protein